jgi:hypothetical protein
MSNQAESPHEEPAEKPGSPTLAETLQFIKDNFVLVSAAAALLGVTFATTILASYLSVFDWHLIWFIQYPDIITFGLIAVGVVSGLVTVLQTIAQAVVAGFEVESRTRRNGIIVIGASLIVLLAGSVWTSKEKGEGLAHIFSGVEALGGTIALFAIVVMLFRKRKMPNSLQAVMLASLFVGLAFVLGQWLGATVRETSDFNQDVYLKDQTLPNVKLIIVMSRHAVLYKADVLYVVPTGDILKFRTADKSFKAKSVPEE